jgi:hypothetical protein
MGQRQARDAAKSYLRSGSFSRAGLIHQLESPYGEDFSHRDAVWGVNHAHANWYAEAVEAAKSYLRSGHFSRQGADPPARIPVWRALHARPGRVRRQQGVSLGIPWGLRAQHAETPKRAGNPSPAPCPVPRSGHRPALGAGALARGASPTDRGAGTGLRLRRVRA